MVKLKSTDTVPLLNVSILGVKFDKKANAKIIGFGMATFADGDKPKILLEIKGKRYDLILNATNQDILGNYLEEMGKERDTDEISNGSIIELEVYDTGSSGAYEYGVRINSITFPK